MNLKRIRQPLLSHMTIAFMLSLVSVTHLFCASVVHGLAEKHSIGSTLQQRLQIQGAIPFLHRPYYGARPVSRRAISFFDHDKPWYAADNVFVRFDGKRWNNATLMGCNP